MRRTSISRRRWYRCRSRARPERARDAGHAARRIRDPRDQRRRRNVEHGGRGQQHHLRPVQARHPDRPRGQRRPQRHLADPRDSARRNHRAAGDPRRCRGRAHLLYRRADVGHDAGTAQLVHRQRCRQAAARPARHRRRRARRRGRSHDPRHARSRGTQRAGDHGRAGQSAAEANQHERRRRTRRDRRLGAIGPGARQRQGCLSAIADADRAARRPVRQARRPRQGAGQQFGAALARQDERAPGRHLLRPTGQGIVRGDGL